MANTAMSLIFVCATDVLLSHKHQSVLWGQWSLLKQWSPYLCDVRTQCTCFCHVCGFYSLSLWVLKRNNYWKVARGHKVNPFSLFLNFGNWTLLLCCLFLFFFLLGFFHLILVSLTSFIKTHNLINWYWSINCHALQAGFLKGERHVMQTRWVEIKLTS